MSQRLASLNFWRWSQRGNSVYRAAADWRVFAGEDWQDRVMSEPVTDRLHEKQGRSIGRRVFVHGQAQLIVYLKRHYRLPFVSGLLAAFFPAQAWSPGLQEWHHLKWAASKGFPVPRPVAAGQMLGPRFRLQGFLAVEELTGMLPLHEAIPLAATRLEPAAFATWKRGLTAELARLAHELHRRLVFHKDLYFCHFYIPEEFTRTTPGNWQNRVVMIDLHRLARHLVLGVWWQAKDLAQLLHSSEVPGVTARDRLRFWKYYCRLGNRSRSGSVLVRLLKWKGRFYDRHARRQREEKAD
jgi:heptose I phosphotransferase